MPMAPSLKAAFTLLKVWKLAVWNGLAAALVVVDQEVFTNYAFRCPCVHDLNVAIVVVVFKSRPPFSSVLGSCCKSIPGGQ
ncbi:unnamed protein product [Lampetra planeri]